MHWLQPRLHLKVSQKQILTPGLVQMVSVLALNRLELREMINQEMVANPVLEEVGDDGLVELPTLKRHLASHLNLTSETFSRTLRRLIDAGLIAQPHASRLDLINRDELRKIAEGQAPKI